MGPAGEVVDLSGGSASIETSLSKELEHFLFVRYDVLSEILNEHPSLALFSELQVLFADIKQVMDEFIVDLEVGDSNDDFVEIDAVVSDEMKNVFANSRNESLGGRMAQVLTIPLQGEGLASTCLSVRENGGVVALED